jgi:hypothetical protein
MLVTFRSKAAADIIMYEQHAKPLLDLIHKDVKRGVITAAELATAVAKLESAVNESKMRPTTEEVGQNVPAPQRSEGDDREPSKFVSFATRAYPLLEMLRSAQKRGNDVMWGI